MSSTRERILAAAVTCFARDGFDVGLREIGTNAGYSAALVIRHFGSKDALRRACDDHVAGIIRQVKQQSAASADMRYVLTQLAQIDTYADILTYTVRSLMTGGELAHQFVEQMIADAVDYLAEGERSGLIRPSADPEGRARYITYSALGAVLVQIRNEYTDGDDLSTLFQDVLNRQLMPSVELYTHGVFTDTRAEDALHAAGYSPARRTPADHPTPPESDIPPTDEGAPQ